MKLYDSIGPNPRIVRMFMAEKGIEMPKQTVDLRGGENRQEEHLKRNPHGQMPTLELDDGSYLSEITAICEYLEEKNPKPAMIGSTAEERAELPDVDQAGRSQHRRTARQRLSFRRRPEVLPKAHPLRAGSLARPQDDCRQRAAMAERPAGGQGISVRQAFYAGGHLLYCWLEFGNQVGEPLDPANSNIVAWMARVGERPSVKA